MKKSVTIFAFLFFVLNINCQSLREPGTLAPLYSHLYEINKEWGKQMPPNNLLEQVQFTSDVDRIQTHLMLVEVQLRKRTFDQNWSAQQLEQREKLLNVLHQYAEAARFPRNTKHDNRQPYFVDDQGTACAVGYLMLASGENEIVDQIQQHNNYAYIDDLLSYPALNDWAQKSGFTTEELAWIQPAYAVVYFTATPFGNNLGSAGEILDLQVKNDVLYMAGDFTSIDGFAANTIISWNGQEMNGFPGIEGRAERIAIDDNGGLYLSGSLEIEGISPIVRLARYSDNEWVAVLTEDNCDGKITDIICKDASCYISGEFQLIEGNNLAHFAHYNIEDATFDSWYDYSFNSTVNDLALVGDTLLLAGSFAMHQTSNTDTLAQLTAGFDLRDSDFFSFDVVSWADDTIVNALFIDGNKFRGELNLLTIFESVNTNKFGGFLSDFPQSGWRLDQLSSSPEISIINGIGANWLVFGHMTLYGDDNFAIFGIPGQSVSLTFPIARSNGAVTALTEFQNQLFIAGEYTEIDGTIINGIAHANLLISDTDDLLPKENQVIVRSNGEQFFIENLPENQKLNFKLFDQNGRLVWKTDFIATTTTQLLTPPRFPAGSYVYTITQKGGISAGQVLILIN